MPRIQKSLPDYQSLVRWTVQDVINWLHDNKFDACTHAFRENGVDGNKFVHSQEPDLVNIGIKRNLVKEIMAQLDTIGRPKNNMRGGAFPVEPPSDRNLVSNDDSDYDWSDGEFDDSDDDPTSPSPVAPPRPNRTLPARNGHREPPALPKQQPVTVNEPDEDYEDPDKGGVKPPPISSMPPVIRTNQKRAPNPIPTQEQEELYEDPDDKPSGPPIPSPVPQRALPIGKRGLPAPPNDDEKELYEDPDDKPSRPPIPSPVPQRALPIGKRGLPAPPNDDEKNYIDPEGKQPAPPPPRNRGKAAPPPYTKVTIEDKPKPPSLANLPSRASFHGDDTPDYLEPEESVPPPVNPPPRGAGGRQRKAPAPIEEQTYEETTCGDSDQETYEEPDVVEPPKRNAPPPLASNTARAPAPPLGGKTGAPVPPLGGKTGAPAPPLGGKTGAPAPSLGGKTGAPAPSLGGKTTRAHPPPLIEQETYEEPDAMKNQPFQEETYEVPEKEQDEEDYLEMEHDFPQTMAPVPTQTRTTPNVPSGRSRAPAPTPTVSETLAVPKRSRNPTPTEEDYENAQDKIDSAPKLPAQNRVLPPPPSSHVETTVSAPPTLGPKEPTEAQLQLQKWYHGSISREAAKEKLFAYNRDGMYLIRRSTKNPAQPFTLQIYFARNDFNLPIRKNGTGEYQVGSSTQTFPSLLEIVNTFKKSRLVLNKATETTLVKSLPKT